MAVQLNESVDEMLTARTQFQADDYAGTLDTCQAILDDNPNCLLALRLSGLCAMELSQLDVASAYFRRCSDIDPEDAVAHVGLAVCADAQGDSAGALGWLRRAREIAPDDPWIADALAERGDASFESALMEARSALRRGQPQLVPALLSQGSTTDALGAVTLMRALWELGRVDETWQIGTHITLQHPTCIGALLYLRSCAVLTERYLHVRAVTRRIDEIDPESYLFGDPQDSTPAAR